MENMFYVKVIWLSTQLLTKAINNLITSRKPTCYT